MSNRTGDRVDGGQREAARAVRRTIIHEERQLIRTGLAGLLGDDPRIAVVGATATWPELVERSIELRPDAVVVGLGGGDAIHDAIRHVTMAVPGVRVVALHAGTDAAGPPRAGAPLVHSLVPYRAGTASIVAGVLGEPVLVLDEPELVERPAMPVRGRLTPRELEVLRCLSQGTTAAECAAVLDVSRKTVDAHKQRIFAKLHVQNQAHAVALALRLGLLDRRPPTDRHRTFAG